MTPHFYIVRKVVGDRVHSTYFESWCNAERCMLQDVDAGRKMGLWGEIKTDRRFLPAKGFEEYTMSGVTRSGEKVSWSILDGYMSDHLINPNYKYDNEKD